MLYKSNSFSINLFIFFLGFIFFSLMTVLIFDALKNIKNNESKIVPHIIVSIFLFFALASLFYFLRTQIIIVTKNHLIVSYQFLPFSKKVLLDDIQGFKQTPKPVKYSRGLFEKQKIVYTMFETFIILKNDLKIRTYSLNDFEFNEIRKLVEKIKRGEGKYETEKSTGANFVFQNFSIILFLIICLFLVFGLSNALINKY